MVQFVITPWRDHSELLRVRQQFFPAQPTPPRSDDARDDVKEKRAALARVYMWLHRGACPHLVEATAYLVDACLLDEESQKWAHGHMQTPALTEGSSRATSLSYATAINLFVTGLLDSHQDKAQKVSMYSIAKTVGLPAALVEIRHQINHEGLPQLSNLRAAAAKALDWIWDRYWRHLPEEGKADDDPGPPGNRAKGPVSKALVEQIGACLTEEDEGKRGKIVAKLRKQDLRQVIDALDSVEETCKDTRKLISITKLTQAILDPNWTDATSIVESITDVDKARGEMSQVRAQLDEFLQEPSHDSQKLPAATKPSRGWSKWEGEWIPKPIGMV